MALTEKQKRFVDEYLVDLNATRAYKAAYPSCKKDETASAASSRLLGNVKVKAYMKERMKQREKRTEVTQDRVLQEYAKIALADIKDFLSFRTEKTVVGYDKDTGDPIIDYAQIIEMKDSDQVDGTMIQEVSISPKGVFSFKLHDKKGALDMLGKHLGMFNDSLHVTGKLDVANPFAGLTTEELKKLIDSG